MATIFKQVKVSGRTLEMTCDVYSLEMAIVYRKDVKDLDDQWKCPGIYVLVWRVGGQKLGGYVGMARELSERISHERKFEWDRALIVRRKAGFNTAQIGWLEGRIYKLLDEGGVNLQNKLEPGDDTLSVPEQETLEKFVEPIQDALVILGYDPESQRPTLKQTAILEPKESIRTPTKMSATMKKRLLARRDEGATYVQLQKEFGLTQGSVYSLLKKAGRIGGS